MDINSINFSQIGKYMRTWLTHSQIFGSKASKEDIIKDIRSINIEEALTILAKFSVLDNHSKISLMNILKPFIRDTEMLEATEPFDLINLMYSVKWFIAYGSNTNISYDNKYPKHLHVFFTVLKISDYMVETLNSTDEVQEQVLKSWLFNRPGELDKALIRQHVMFEDIAKNRDLFSKNEYVDIHSIFENEYGYSIQEYVASLFTLHYPCINELNLKDVLTDIDWGINNQTFFDNIKIRETTQKIAQELTTDIKSLKAWARHSLTNPFDYEILLSKPIFESNGRLIPFSPGFLNSTIFDGLCFKLNNCCRKAKKSFFPFFGRLFEQYVSKTLSDAVQNSQKISYTFIDEFTYGKENKRSSDAYLLLGRSLIIFECKGGRLRKETKILAQPDFSEGDYKKYALDPITQANSAYVQILSEDPNIFHRVNKVYILSVSLQAFPKIPKYNESLVNIQNELHKNIKEIDYIGLSDLELLAYIINFHDFSIFHFIKNKKQLDDFVPYLNYYFKKYGEIKRAQLQDSKLKECLNTIRETLF